MITFQSQDPNFSRIKIEFISEDELNKLWDKFKHKTQATKSFSMPEYENIHGSLDRVMVRPSKVISVEFTGQPNTIQEIINYHSILMEN
jgi:hypothetical protein